MTTRLPNSPVRKIFQCRRCNTVSVYFYDPKHDRSYTFEEWMSVRNEGREALDKILATVKGNPIFFSQ